MAPGHFHLCGILERLCEAVHSFVLPGQIHTSHSGAADAGVYKNDYGTVYIGVALSVIPILIMFVLCSRRILGRRHGQCCKGITQVPEKDAAREGMKGLRHLTIWMCVLAAVLGMGDAQGGKG